MPPAQTLPSQQSDPAKLVHRSELNEFAYDQYLTFCASSGLSMDEDGNITPVTVKEFAAGLGIDRSLLYYWKRQPGFWANVDRRAKEIFNQSTKYAIMKGLKLKAMAGDARAAEMVLSHYSDYTPPAQKHEVKLTGWGDVVREARKMKIKATNRANAVEAQVVSPPYPPQDNSGQPSLSPTLSPAPPSASPPLQQPVVL